MQNGMKSLSQRMNEAGNEAGAGAKLFNQLGVAVKGSDGSFRDQEEVFKDTIIALQGMEDGVHKAAMAQQLFGRNGQEMLPMLNASKGSIEDLMGQARDLGLVMSDDAVTSGVALTDQMDAVKRSFAAITNEVGVALMPIIEKFLSWVMEKMPAIKEVMEPVFQAIGKAVNIFVDIVKGIMKTFKEVFDFVAPIVRKFVEENEERFVKMGGKLGEVWEKLNVAIKKIFEFLKPFIEIFINNIVTFITNAFDLILEVIDFFINIFSGNWKGAWENIKNIVGGVFEAIKNFFQGLWEFVLLVLEKINNFFISIFQGILDFVGGIFISIATAIQGAWDKIKNMVSSVFTFFKDMFIKIGMVMVSPIVNAANSVLTGLEKMVNGAVNMLNRLITGANKVPGVNIPYLATVSFKKVPMPSFDVGTNFVPNDMIAQIHKGEMIVPKKFNPAAGGVGLGTTININNPMILNERDVDILGERLVHRLRQLGAVPV